MDDATRRAAQDFLDALEPSDASTRAMFGGYCVYLQGKVVALVCDGAVFVKRSAREELLDGLAAPGHAYPGATQSWRLDPRALEQPETLREAVLRIAEALPPPRRKTP